MPRNVAFTSGTDTCGDYGIVSSIAQKTSQWIILTSTAPFRVEVERYFNPFGYVLKKSDRVLKNWNLPEGFKAISLSDDLRNLYLQAPVKSSTGRSLAILNLLVSDSGAAQFVEKIPTAKVINISAKDNVPVKSNDGVQYSFSRSTCP
jgi:hypothetical protein